MYADAWPDGLGRVILDQTDTTNAEAARRAALGHSATWILAGFQTAGRGRRGRPWVSPRGNFHATLLMPFTGGPSQAALRSFIAALALDRALCRLTGLDAHIGLKWPNDVLVNGGKISGILLETLPAPGGQMLAVGIGVNLIAAPDPDQIEPGAVAPVSVLGETGIRITPERFLDHLARAFADLEADFAAGGFAPIRQAWLARALRLGERITARAGHGSWEGILRGIDADGALQLETAEGLLVLSAADIHF